MPPAGVGQAQGPPGHHRLRGARHRRQRVGRSARSPNESARACSVTSRCPRRRTARRRRCTCSATSRTSRPRARSSSSIAAGTTAPASSTSWASAARSSTRVSCGSVPPRRNGSSSAGIQLIKLWLEVGPDEQERRMTARIDDPLRRWKLSPMDLESWPRWYEYSRARDRMFAATDTKHAPWYILRSDDKRRARLNCLAHILKSIPYKHLPHERVTLPKRSTRGSLRRPGEPEGASFRRREVLNHRSAPDCRAGLLLASCPVEWPPANGAAGWPIDRRCSRTCRSARAARRRRVLGRSDVHAAAGGAARRLAGGEQPAPGAPAPPPTALWWKGFNDPVLDRLVDLARRQNLPLQSRRAADRRGARAVGHRHRAAVPAGAGDHRQRDRGRAEQEHAARRASAEAPHRLSDRLRRQLGDRLLGQVPARRRRRGGRPARVGRRLRRRRGRAHRRGRARPTSPCARTRC